MSSPLLPNPRRIVTTHNEQGKAIIQIDDNIHSETMAGLEHLRTGTFWVTSDGLPTKDNNNNEDGATREVGGLGLVQPRGTNFKYTDLGPGAVTPMHRTTSLDYNILIRGELILIADDGTERHLVNPGDAVIQKGTIHAWRNPGNEWARWATVLIDADAADVDGKILGEALQ